MEIIKKVKEWTVLPMPAYLTTYDAPTTEKYQAIMASVTIETKPMFTTLPLKITQRSISQQNGHNSNHIKNL
ncbi:hypothetical protein [Gibbsiella quercinecans]|uniref:hypothetical protein n=1 Tax=Gibbsiella quercinecans TaxID=929813 RepID=UPI0011C39C02|nr:hypothetical protein [Gibbsiella quercinecans]